MRKPGNPVQNLPSQTKPAGSVVGDTVGPSKVNVVGDRSQDQWQKAEGRLCFKNKVVQDGKDDQQRVVTQANQFGELSEERGMLDCSEVPAGDSFKGNLFYDPGALECPRSE
ncbi:hypothetical protein Dimus_006714 [Dionaea muscipula]